MVQNIKHSGRLQMQKFLRNLFLSLFGQVLFLKISIGLRVLSVVSNFSTQFVSLISFALLFGFGFDIHGSSDEDVVFILNLEHSLVSQSILNHDMHDFGIN